MLVIPLFSKDASQSTRGIPLNALKMIECHLAVTENWIDYFKNYQF